MRFKTLALQGFKSFETDEVLYFPKLQSGFYLVTGENQVEPELGANGCLSGDTLIDCPRDLIKYPKGIPIRDLVGKQPWVYAWKDGKIVIRRAARVWRTMRQAEVVRVVLTKYATNQGAPQGGKYIPPLELVGTPGHPVLLSDGVTWKPLGKLVSGDSLCSLYRRGTPGSRTLLRWTGSPAAVSEQQFVCTQALGPRTAAQHAHHKNRNEYDHRPENLEWKDASAHLSEHTSARNREGTAGWKVSGVHPRGMLGKHHTTATRQRMSQNLAGKTRPALHRRVTKVCEQCGEEFWVHLSTARREAARFCSPACWYDFRNAQLQSSRRINHTVISVEQCAGREDVYDMTVPGADSFVANGVVVHNSGKSTIWDALVWALYGKTARGAKASAVANRKGQQLTSVVVEFELDGEFYGLTRTWNPNSLVLDEEGKEPRPISQEELDLLLGVNYDGFLHTSIVGQFNQLFFDLSPTEKLNVLSQFLELDVWVKAADLARKREAAKLAEAVTKDREAAQLQTRREMLERNLAAAKREAAEHEAQQRARRVELRTQQASAQALLEGAQEAYAKAEKGRDAAQRRQRQAEQRLVLLDEQRTEARARVVRLQAADDQAEAAEASLLEARERVSNLEGNCPTCYQPIDRQHKHHAIAELDSKLETAKEERDRVEAALDAAQAKLKAIEADVREADKQHDAAGLEIVALDGKRDVAARRLGAAKADVAAAARQLEQLAAVQNTAQHAVRTTEVELASTVAALATCDGALEAIRAEAAACEYWGGRFKDVRLWVVEQALTELEIHINNALGALGLEGYKIAFDIERPRSDGHGVIRGFQVMIHSPESPDPIPWEAWSGGETQRLRLAGAVGIADLVSARRGYASSLEVWDEPTAHLSQEGIDDLLTFLSTRARTNTKQVYLVDHRALNAGDFDGEIRIVKTELGSTIKQAQRSTHPKQARSVL